MTDETVINIVKLIIGTPLLIFVVAVIYAIFEFIYKQVHE